MAYNKGDVVKRLRKKGYTIPAANEIFSDVFDTLAEIISEGEDVYIRGFGTFKCVERASKSNYDFHKKCSYKSPPYKACKLILSPGVKRKLNEK